MAGAVDVVSHTEIERGRNGNTVLHSSYSTTSVTRLCSWGVGGCVCSGEFMASCDSNSEMDIYKVASYSISRSCFYIENCLCHKQLMDEGGIVYEPCLPLLFHLFYL